jgi:hypothetical protein
LGEQPGGALRKGVHAQLLVRLVGRDEELACRVAIALPLV